jgi:RNA polymerase sigma-70 factor (ECF subfamily)
VPEEPPDAQACRLLERGDPGGAFELLLVRYQGKVFRLAMSFVRSPADAEDLAQEVFVRVWRALPRYDGRASLSTWIYAITRNTCLSELRRRRARPKAALGDGPAAEPAAPDPSPATLELGAGWDALLDELPEGQRRAVRLFYLEERSYDEVSRLLGLPLNTVRSHLHRARKRLAALWGRR